MRYNSLQCYLSHPVIACTRQLVSQACMHFSRSNNCQRATVRRMLPQCGQANAARILYECNYDRRGGGKQHLEDRPLQWRMKATNNNLARFNLLQRPVHRRSDGEARTLARSKKRRHRCRKQGFLTYAAEQHITALDVPWYGGLDNNDLRK